MESRKYSVIIPAYNAEKTIERCLDSILCYDRDDIEILIINDGSSDRTEDICKSYSSSEDRIRYYYKPNGGVSSARNMGLSLAKGIYILFIDSDDFLCGDVFSLADREMEQGVEWLVYSAESKTTGMNDSSPLRMMDGGKVADKLSELLKKQMLNAVISKEKLDKFFYTKNGFQKFTKQEYIELGKKAGFRRIRIKTLGNQYGYLIIYTK